MHIYEILRRAHCVVLDILENGMDEIAPGLRSNPIGVFDD